MHSKMLILVFGESRSRLVAMYASLRLYLMGNYDEAAVACKKALTFFPNPGHLI